MTESAQKNARERAEIAAKNVQGEWFELQEAISGDDILTLCADLCSAIDALDRVRALADSLLVADKRFDEGAYREFRGPTPITKALFAALDGPQPGEVTG